MSTDRKLSGRVGILPAGEGVSRSRTSSASAIQAKLDNAGARSHLEEAIAEIRRANACWPFRYADGLIESLRQLQAKIKGELPVSGRVGILPAGEGVPSASGRTRRGERSRTSSHAHNCGIEESD